MFKKAIVTSLAVLLVAGVTLGRDACSYFSTAWNRTTASVTDAVPIDFQIDRARQMVHNLAPEVRNSMRVIAKEEIALDRLNEQITSAEKKTEQGQTDILRLSADLQSDQSVFRYAGRSYSRAEVTEDLTRRFTRHKVKDETLSHMQEMRNARQHNLDAARQKLTAMISAQKNLEADITNLEAKRKLVTVAQASSDLEFDDSQLARAKGLIADIRSRLDVAARLANADLTMPGEIILDEAESLDVLDQVTAYFGAGEESDSPMIAQQTVHAKTAIVQVVVD